MPESLDYLRRLLAEVLGQTFKFSAQQVLPILVAVATLVLQVTNRTSSSTDFRGNLLSTITPYLVAVGAYFVIQFLRAPVTLDRERAKEIEKIASRLGGEVSVTFKTLGFEHPVPDKRNTRLRIDVAFRTSDAPATLGSWALRSEKAPSMNPVCSYIWGFNQRLGGGSFRLEAHDHQSGAFAFDFMGTAQATEEEIIDPLHHWCLEFTDAHRTYSEPIRTELFVSPA
jgi:hypothetical protein